MPTNISAHFKNVEIDFGSLSGIDLEFLRDLDLFLRQNPQPLERDDLGKWYFELAGWLPILLTMTVTKMPRDATRLFSHLPEGYAVGEAFFPILFINHLFHQVFAEDFRPRVHCSPQMFTIDSLLRHQVRAVLRSSHHMLTLPLAESFIYHLLAADVDCYHFGSSDLEKKNVIRFKSFVLNKINNLNLTRTRRMRDLLMSLITGNTDLPLWSSAIQLWERAHSPHPGRLETLVEAHLADETNILLAAEQLEPAARGRAKALAAYFFKRSRRTSSYRAVSVQDRQSEDLSIALKNKVAECEGHLLMEKSSQLFRD